MPLLVFDAVKGRSKKEVKTLLDAAHRAVLSAFGVPERDRYQIYHEHRASHFIVQDTGLGIKRTRNVVLITVISRPRTKQLKLQFYTDLCRELEKSCDIAPSDVMVSIVSNTDADWSFGNGEAQFLTGKL
jgi:hypothetical protein